MTPRSPTRNRLAVWAPGVVALALALSTIPGSFVFDDRLIELDPRLASLGNVPGLFLDNYWGDVESGGLYRPLTLASFAIERTVLGSRSAAAHHATNALFYGLCAAAVAWLALRAGAASRVALLAGLLFACHPIHVEAVAGLVGRAELGAGLALTLALALEVGDLRRGRDVAWRRATGVGLLALVAFLFKESALALVPLLVVAAFVFGARDARGFERLRRTLRHRWRLWAAVGAAVVVWGGLRALALEGARPEPLFLNNLLAHREIGARVAGALDVTNRYHRMALWPWPLSADYSYAALVPTTRLLSGPALLGLAIWIALGVLAWAARRARPLVAFGTLLYAIALFPVTNLILPIGTIFGERLLFAPSIGVCLVLAAIFGTLEGDRNRRWVRGVAGAVLVLGAVAFMARTRDWRSNETLAAAMVRTQPGSAKAHTMYGWELYKAAVAEPARAADLERAQRHLEQAVEILGDADPAFVDAHINLALVATHRGERELARRTIAELLRRAPRRFKALNAAAGVYLGLGDYERAVEMSVEGLRTYPRHPELTAMRDRAIQELLRAGAYTRAAAACRRALEVDALALTPLHLLVRALALEGDTDGALEVADRVLAIDRSDPAYARIEPELAAFHNDRGLVHKLRGDDARAIEDFSRALELDPNLVVALGNRAEALIRTGRLAEAEADIRRLAARGAAVSGLQNMLSEARAGALPERTTP